MSAAEETIKPREIAKPKSPPIGNRILDFLSSVSFGVTLLCVLVALSVLGMLIVQQNVQGFDAFFASLTPAEKTIYGYLGLFDVYHSWYFNLLLLILSLNIVLASIDRFPAAWKYITEPKRSATRGFLLNQKHTAVVSLGDESDTEAAEKIKSVFEANGFRTNISESEKVSYKTDAQGRKDFSETVTRKHIFVFGESGKYNRLGAYIVHVFLLTLFLGHFVALQTGFDADVRLTTETNPQMLENFAAWQKSDTIQLIQFNLDKQERYNVQLPFTITCTDIEQKLIDAKGEININNTLDWRTQIKIDDPAYGTTVADVSLNKPFSYRGYRFFQASAIAVGSARRMTLAVIPEAGGEPIKVELARNGTAELPDGTKISYETFLADFVMQGSEVTTRSAEYNNPAVVLNITPPNNGETTRVFAFANKLPDNAPINAPKAGYRWRLSEFEKAPMAHVLSIKYDPFEAAFIAWYIGGFGLVGAIGFVFFFSHRRVWAMIDRENCEIVYAGDANRNSLAFGDKFDRVVADLGGEKTVSKQED